MAAPLVLTAQPLTAVEFAPFGDVIEAGAAATRADANDGTAERYSNITVLDVMAESGQPALSIFRARHPTILPLRVTRMERHKLASQAFIPIGGATFLVVVAPPGDEPDVSAMQAFMAAGTQGVNYRPGVWHHPLLALRAGDDFVVIERGGAGRNLDLATLADDVVVVA